MSDRLRLPAVFRRGPRPEELALSAQVAALQGDVGSISDMRAQIARLESDLQEAKAVREIVASEQPLAGNLVDYASAWDDQRMVALYGMHPMVYACVAYIAESLPLATLRMYKAGALERGRETLDEWDEHPVGNTFRWINGEQSPFEFWEWMLSFLQLTGDCWAVIEPRGPQTPEGVPFELYPLQTQFVRVIHSARGGIVGIEYQAGGQTARFLTDELMHVSTFSPTERQTGQGRIQAGYMGVQTDLRARASNDNMLRNGVHIAGVLESEEDLKVEQMDATREQFMRRYAGQDKAFRVAILTKGLKFKPTQFAPSDMQYIEQGKVSREEIAILHGIPLELMGLMSANYATLREKRRLFWQDTVQRWGKRIESGLNSTFLRRFDPALRCAWDYSEIEALKTNLLDVVRSGPQALAGQYTINEWRTKLLGLDHIDEPWADELIRPAGPPSANPAMPADPNTQKTRRIGGKTFGVVTKRAMRAREWRQMWQSAQQKAESAVELAAREVLNGMREDIRAIVRSDARHGATQDAEIEHRYMVDGRKQMVEAISPVLLKHARAWATATGGQIVSKKAFGISDERASRRLAKQEQRIRDMMGRNWMDLRSALKADYDAGAPVAQIEATVWNFFDGEKANFRTVARTEVAPALNGAANDAMLEAISEGVNVKSVWRTFLDDKVRGSDPKDEFNHAAMEGVAISPGDDEMFLVSGEHLAYPGDFSNGASAGNTINCRCMVMAEVVE